MGNTNTKCGRGVAGYLLLMPRERKRRGRQERVGWAPAARETANPPPPEASPAAVRKVTTEKPRGGMLAGCCYGLDFAGLGSRVGALG